MTRLLPKSLLGQVTLAVALTLFLVQGVNGVITWRMEQERSRAELVNALGLRLIASQRIREGEVGGFGERPASEGGLERRAGERFPDRGRRGGRRFAGTDFRRADSFVASPADVAMPELEQALAQSLRDNGREFDEVRMVARPVSADPPARAFLTRLALRRGIDPDDLPETIAVAGVSDGAGWDIVRAPIRERDRRFGAALSILRAAALTLILSLVLWLVLRRITGPLADLTRRTEAFAKAPGSSEPMDPRGPDDVRRLIDAHNIMEARIGAMLDEKDVMLGAIGHDLKTPLAALRVRVEGVADEAARERMVDSIEDITRTLDEILLLARLGRSDRPAERTDLNALLVSVVEEFEDMDQPVTLSESQRLPVPIHLTWLKRGVRNLVSNALRYGGSAEISLTRQDGEAVIAVMDRGPGIPENRIAEMLEPFTRGEVSRNRATGGAGLGLTIARAVAEQHGGRLILANRNGGGLRAELRLPL